MKADTPRSNQSTPDPLRLARPHLHQRAREIQPFGSLVRLPIALDEKTRTQSVALLNQLLADTMTLRDLYKKHHWQTAGATFYQLHLLYDKHYEEQVQLTDALANRTAVSQRLEGLRLPDFYFSQLISRAVAAPTST